MYRYCTQCKLHKLHYRSDVRSNLLLQVKKLLFWLANAAYHFFFPGPVTIICPLFFFSPPPLTSLLFFPFFFTPFSFPLLFSSPFLLLCYCILPICYTPLSLLYPLPSPRDCNTTSIHRTHCRFHLLVSTVNLLHPSSYSPRPFFPFSVGSRRKNGF